MRQGQCCGYIYASKIDKVKKTAETNIIIEEKFHNTSYPFKAAVALSYFFFKTLDFNVLNSVVKKNNKGAIDFNTGLGFIVVDDSGTFIKLKCDKKSFYKKLKRMLPLLEKFFEQKKN